MIDLKKARLEAGLTQKQLADIIGRSAQAVRFWEWGQRQPNLISTCKLINYFKSQSIEVPLSLKRIHQTYTEALSPIA